MRLGVLLPAEWLARSAELPGLRELASLMAQWARPAQQGWALGSSHPAEPSWESRSAQATPALEVLPGRRRAEAALGGRDLLERGEPAYLLR